MNPDPRFSSAEVLAMEHALLLAGRGIRGANPLVGAVVLDEAGAILGAGHHRGAGTPHAEADALAKARENRSGLNGSTIVVTLEPCSHQGRTGPCTAAIAEAGIRRVVYGASDPNPEAAGGAAWLTEHGIDTAGGLLEQNADALNGRWATSVRERRPFVTLKAAQTLDSQTAAADGTSQWITGPHARADGHAIRAVVDAVLVGTGTVLADNPRLTARLLDGSDSERQPLRVVMGERDVPPGADIRGERFIHLRTRNPHAALAKLYGQGVRHVLIEGGARIGSAFLRADLVDEMFVYIAPILLGDGIPAFQQLGVGTLADAQSWLLDADGGASSEILGNDIRLHLKPAPAARSDLR